MEPLLLALLVNLAFSIALIVYMIYLQKSFNIERHQNIKEREMLVKANMARDLTDLTVSETMKQDANNPEKEVKKSDFVPVDELDDKAFDELIKKQNGG